MTMNQRSLKRLRTTSPRRRQPCVNVRGWHCIFIRQTYVALKQCPRGWIGDAEHYLTVGSLLASCDSVTVIWLAAAECRGADMPQYATWYMFCIKRPVRLLCQITGTIITRLRLQPVGMYCFLGTTDVGLWFCLSTKIDFWPELCHK